MAELFHWTADDQLVRSEDDPDPPAACVLPDRLWIGSQEARARTPPPWTTVITLMQRAEDADSLWGRQLAPLPPTGPVASHHYFIGDTATVDLRGVLTETAFLIEHAPGPVLVHCAMGKSRSATVVVHYLWAVAGIGRTPEDTLRWLQNTWPRAQPNASFMAQIAAMPRRRQPVA
jgi:hypothetical protein